MVIHYYLTNANPDALALNLHKQETRWIDKMAIWRRNAVFRRGMGIKKYIFQPEEWL